MGITMGCMANSMHVMPIGSDGTSSGPSQWTMTGDDGRRLSLTQLKESIKVPLTEREVFVITKSWKTISRNMTHIGIAMFLRMFEARADVMAMFEQFRSVDKADLGASQALENHAMLVMCALDEAISNMDDPEFLIDMLLSTGKSHQRFENFSMQIFWAIEEPFLTAVKEALGDRFTPTMAVIYRKTIRFILTTLTTGFMYYDMVDGDNTSLKSSMVSASSSVVSTRN